ncbi:hypothetical protein IJ768_01490 [Candidatus Saccharibacteria bacterium]|nr:hypothetical protein [Candidatus Saccharibacteria bacterium]
MEKFRVDTSKLSIRELIELKRLEYKRLEPVKCPLLNDELVHFNKMGFIT